MKPIVRAGALSGQGGRRVANSLRFMIEGSSLFSREGRMSIRNKLLAIVIGFVVLIGVSFGLFLAFQLPIQKMEAERTVLHD
jgi:hypothetical protein